MRPTSNTKTSDTPARRKIAQRPALALTPGEPAGIGPDLAVRLADGPLDYDLTIVADPVVLAARARQLGCNADFSLWPERDARGVSVLAVDTAAPVRAGSLDPRNAHYVLDTLRRAVHGCVGGAFDAMVTGPVHKGVINDAGIPFTGHTEFLAQETQTRQVVMMLIAGDLRVALATTHLPLSAVSGAITREHLRTTLEILQRDLQQRFAISAPRILVLGLNPHAGEGGHLGREEIEVIAPVLQQLNAQGMDLRGPVPADTAFTPQHLQDADAVLAMYHDQGLPVLKHVGFGRAVNITLGLPIVRTSVDHGTALDLAGSGRADGGSLEAAVALALSLVRARATA